MPGRDFVAALYSVVLPQGRRLQMADLRTLAEDLGLQAPQTVGSSGNLIFAVPTGTASDWEGRLEAGFAQRFGKLVPILVRPAATFARVPARNPFGTRFDAQRISVRLMREPCDAELVQRLQPYVSDEALAVAGGDLWLGFAGEPGASRLPAAFKTRAFPMVGTFRTLAMIERIVDTLRSRR